MKDNTINTAKKNLEKGVLKLVRESSANSLKAHLLSEFPSVEWKHLENMINRGMIEILPLKPYQGV